MKYEFVKIDEDTTELRYKDKVFTFVKNVEMLRDMQSINFRAKARMMNELKKMGMSADDLVITKKEGSKTYEDKTNLIELEQYCLSVEAEETYNIITQKYCGMSLAQLLTDIGIEINQDNSEEVINFTDKINKAIVGKTETPSQKN